MTRSDVLVTVIVLVNVPRSQHLSFGVNKGLDLVAANVGVVVVVVIVNVVFLLLVHRCL